MTTRSTLARPNPTRCPWCWAGFPGHKPASECTCAAEEASVPRCLVCDAPGHSADDCPHGDGLDAEDETR